MNIVLLITFLLSLTTLKYVHSFPNGPPRSACANGLPVHTKDGKLIEPQTSSSPFVITANATTIRPGETIRIRIHSFTGAMFKGLFLQVRPLPNNDSETFKSAPIGEYYRRTMNSKTISCVNSLDTLVHKDPFMKIENKIDWKSPLLMEHDVVVTTTVLKDFSTYWTNVESHRIKLVRDSKLPAENLKKPWLNDIIKTVKSQDDPEERRKLIRERFERGYKGTFDPNGYIMVQYINDMLPFEDKFPPDFNIAVVEDTASQINGTANMTAEEVMTDADSASDGFDVSPPRKGEPTIEIPLGVKIKKGNSTVETEFDKLVKSLIQGKYSDIDKLSEILKNMN